MYNSETEILFPLKFVPSLADARGEDWRKLIEFVASEAAGRVDKIAFILMMVRLNGCPGCNADSFRAMKGCELCARQTVRRYRSGDQELISLFDSAKVEAEHFIVKQARDRSTS
jgi:hypothetical protein